MKTQRQGSAAVALVMAFAFAITLAVKPVSAQTAAAPAGGTAPSSDRFVAGSSLRIADRTPGDLIAAAGQIELSAPVDGDAVLVGGDVRVTGALGRNVYAGGGRVRIDAALARHVRAAGGQVEIGSAANVAGNATLFGGDVTVRGPVRGALRIAAGRVRIDSAVDGDVDVSAGRVELGPNARLGGALRWRSGEELQRDASAQVAGAVERSALPMPGPHADMREHRRSSGMGWAAGLAWTVGLMLVTALLLAALPGVCARVAATLRQQTGWSLLVGFVALVCVPLAALVLLLTVIGAPLALLAMLAYAALLPLGYVASAIGLGQWGLARFNAAAVDVTAWRIGAAVLALVVLAVLGSVPWLGGWIAFAAMLFGLGAVLLQLRPKPTVGA